LQVRARYRAPLVGCRIDYKGNKVMLDQEVRAITAGQSAVFYLNDQCLGGGIIC
jgi:tRNA-specific 2-thiouridylase